MVKLLYDRKEGYYIQVNLKQIRENKNFKQSEIAKMAGISFVSYNRYETCKRKPDVYTAQKIAKCLGKTVEELFPLNT